MNKILLAIDATSPDKNSLDFASYLARLSKSKLIGVFLENLVSEERPVFKRIEGAAYVSWEVNEKSPQHLIKMDSIRKCIQWFKQGCIARETLFQIHRHKGAPAAEIIEESRFADIIIADSESSFSKKIEGIPGNFLKDILKKSECPVIIAPEQFESIDEIAFAYDASASSVFAIKQFTYLLPYFKDKMVNIVHVNVEGKWKIHDKQYFKEWLGAHYRHLNFVGIKDSVDNGLFSYLFKKKNTFLVMGAYGRKPLSLFLKKSNADKIIQTTTQPVFIAHF